MSHLLRFVSIAMIIVAGVVLFCGCAYVFGGMLTPMNGSGVVKTVDTALPATLEKITLDHINLFPSINSSIKFVLHAGSEPRVSVTADDNIIDDLSVSVSGNTLNISGKPRRSYNSNNIKIDIYGQSYKTLSVGLVSRVDLSTDGALEAETLFVTASGMVTGGAEIKAKEATFTVSGSGDLLLSGTADKLKYTISGSAKIDTASITASDVNVIISGSGTAILTAQKTVNCTVSGSGSLKMAGAVDTLDVSVSGSGKVDASALVANKAKLIITGSGNANVNVKDDLDITVTGSGHIKYIGTPKLTQRITGSGTIENISQ